jgi:hypothetical protein
LAWVFVCWFFSSFISLLRFQYCAVLVALYAHDRAHVCGGSAVAICSLEVVKLILHLSDFATQALHLCHVRLSLSLAILLLRLASLVPFLLGGGASAVFRLALAAAAGWRHGRRDGICACVELRRRGEKRV